MTVKQIIAIQRGYKRARDLLELELQGEKCKVLQIFSIIIRQLLDYNKNFFSKKIIAKIIVEIIKC